MKTNRYVLKNSLVIDGRRYDEGATLAELSHDERIRPERVLSILNGPHVDVARTGPARTPVADATEPRRPKRRAKQEAE